MLQFSSRSLTFAFLLALLLLSAVPGQAQDTCAAPPVTLRPKGPTIFSPEQEGYLGDIVAEQMSLGMIVYPQAELTAPLDQIATRLLKYLPENQYRFQFSLVEFPEPNAFALPGGRILVSPRLISFAESEDELAAVLAHEMGHILARQASVEMTKAFKDVLGESVAGDREDILRKFNLLLDRSARNSGSRKRAEDDQTVADQVSAEATWRAGYAPEAGPRFFDRLLENKGETGGFFSDFFGLTRPESKRFREMMKTANSIPARCKETRAASNDAEFKAWQQKVGALTLNDLVASKSNRTPTRVLTPKLRPQVTNILFSPDGNLLLVQNESSIDILRREPLQHVFRIPALGAGKAVFNKQSDRIFFQAAGGRLEIWSTQTRNRERVWQPGVRLGCALILPSPDGRVVACMPGVFADVVSLVDTETSAEIGRHDFNIDVFLHLTLMSAGVRPIHTSFSPDGSSFLAATFAGAAPWAFNLDKRAPISIGDPLKSAVSSSFAFVGADRVVTSHWRNQNDSGVFSWPDGKVIDKFFLPKASLSAATNGAFLMIRPFREFPVVVMDLSTKQVFQASSSPALDRYGSIGASERTSGEIGLYASGQSQPTATLQLPDSDLFQIRSAAHSPDLQWLAFSVRDRGTYWNQQTGEASLTTAFDAPYISPENVWSAYFELRETVANGQGEQRVTYRKNIDLQSRREVNSSKIPPPDDSRRMLWKGRYVFELTLPRTPNGKPTLQVQEASTGKALWSQEVDGQSIPHLGNALILQYDVKDRVADRFIKQNAELKRVLDETRNRNDLSFLQVISLEKGEILGHALINDGGAAIQSVNVAGRILFVEDSSNRTLAYSLDTGLRTGQQFGRVLAVDSVRGLAAVQNSPGSVTIFNGSMRSLTAFEFPRNVIYAGFDQTGERLLVLSGAQEVFIENIPK